MNKAGAHDISGSTVSYVHRVAYIRLRQYVFRGVPVPVSEPMARERRESERTSRAHRRTLWAYDQICSRMWLAEARARCHSDIILSNPSHHACHQPKPPANRPTDRGG